jgi:hypothetical protein
MQITTIGLDGGEYDLLLMLNDFVEIVLITKSVEVERK